MSKDIVISYIDDIKHQLPTGEFLGSSLGRQLSNIGLGIANNQLRKAKGILGDYKANTIETETMKWKVGKKTYRFGGNISNTKQLGTNVVSTPPLFSFRRRKKIITTPINGGGDVVEYIALQAYDIRMRGIMVDMDRHQFPAQQLQTLRKLFESNTTIQITTGQLFQIMDITEMYVTDWSVHLLEGYTDTISYSLEARSIEPQTFQLHA